MNIQDRVFANIIHFGATEMAAYKIQLLFDSEIEKVKKEYEKKLRWIPVEEKLPECELQDKGIFYSKYLEIKVKGYKHPIIGYYVKANDDQFFDFIYSKIGEEIPQADVTHFRFIP